ncbi:helicase ARIP4-like, partial [Anoplophora glabripennis]
LDGSTSALEREKLINEFNSNPKIHLFLVSTRAGSLGINLIGANRVVVLDASWNPCHDTQAVCRVYRYGQRKPCFVYRLVVDNCLEKKIYDRQINKQGMSDRVVDECNPDAHLTLKDVSTLCWDDKRDEGEEKDWSRYKDNYIDVVLQKVLEKYGRSLNKEPFQHESLLVDRKEKQLSQQEKRLAKKGYEREKQAARQPAYNLLGSSRGHRPVASVRPMQQGERPSRWIPAEHWQRQGMTAQEMTLPLDVVIPTNQPEKGNIVLKAGQKVLVLKSPKGVYMQLESGKIVAIKTAIKVKGKAEDNHDPTKMTKTPVLPPSIKANPSLSVVPQKRAVKPFTPGATKFGVQSVKQSVPNLVSRIRSIQKKLEAAKAKPYNIGSEIAKSLNKEDSMPMSSSDDDQSEKKHVETADEIQKRISMLKKNISIQRVTSQPKQPPPQPPPPVEHKDSSSESSALEQLEHTTSSVLNDNTPFQ